MRFAPEKTATKRKDSDGNPKMTMPTRLLLENGPSNLFWNDIFCEKVLDFGAGKSFDAQLIVERIDMVKVGISYEPNPHEGFEDRSEYPEGPFGLVVCNYVLNVLETEEQRREVIRQVFSLMNKFSHAMFSVRSDSNIAKQNFPEKVSEDTFISRKTKEWYQVQKGFSESELLSFIKETMDGQAVIRHIPFQKKPPKDCTMVLFRKRLPSS